MATLRAFRPGLAPPVSYRGTPFGHIVEDLTVAGGFRDGSYPFGIDCSHLVDRLLAAIGGTKEVVPESGTRISIPSGWYATPIEHAKDLKAGDIFIKDGHVVIFARTIDIGNAGRLRRKEGSVQSAVGFVVYEAASRCGRVCKSVYGLDYFNGWWMLRARKMTASGTVNPNGEPKWASRTVATTYARPPRLRSPAS